MRKKILPPLLMAALEKNNVDIATVNVNTITISLPDFNNISSTGSRVKCYYPSPKEIRPGGFWQKKSPYILHAIIHQLPPAKYNTASELLDLFSIKVTA